MLALAKGYTPGLPQLLAVLGITEDIARQPWRDPLGNCTGNGHGETEEDYGVHEHEQQHEENKEEDEMACCWALVESIRVRQLFGGMTGDMAMLRRYESLWQRRFRRRRHYGSNTNDSRRPVGANPTDTPPGIADGHQAWLEFLLDSYTSQTRASTSTLVRQNGDGITTSECSVAHPLDTTPVHRALLHRLSGYGTAVAAATSTDVPSPMHMNLVQQDADPGGTPATYSIHASAVSSVGVYVTELGRRCAAVICASTSGMATNCRVADDLPNLAAWLALKRGDVPPSAIDFHCSNVIDSLLQRTELRAAVLAAHKSSLHPSDWEAADSLDAIFAGAKTAMWVCSSSINHKSIIAVLGSANQRTEGEEPWSGGYYDGDPVPPIQHQRIWAVMAEAARVLQQGVIDSRVPRRPS